MVLLLYNIRENGVDDRDPYKMYKTHSTLFSIKLHHGGVFTKLPNRKYNNSNITFVDMIDSDEFSVHEIVSMLEDLGHDGHKVMFYHFLKPCCNLDNGLEPLACDKDVVLLAKYVTEGLKLLEVYVEHEKTNPDIYTPPKPKILIMEELDDVEPRTSKARITPVAKKLVLDVNETGQSSVVGNDGSSQVPINNREGNTSPNVEVEDRTEGEDGTKVEHGP
ncbi:hypothetical protein Tco_1285814 [Tanacetum coccineum]